MNSYKDLRINQDAFDIAFRIREEALKLGRPDKFEIGAQIRHPSISIFQILKKDLSEKNPKQNLPDSLQ